MKSPEYNLQHELLLVIHFGNGTLNHARILYLTGGNPYYNNFSGCPCSWRYSYNTTLLDKRSPQLGAIIFGLLIGFVAFLVPDPNAPITDAPWPHNWIHVYCSHALLWVHADQAEEGCHPGPESRAFMADLQILARYPVYEIILNIIPYTYPAIVAFLIVAALPEHIFTRGRTSALADEPVKRAEE